MILQYPEGYRPPFRNGDGVEGFYETEKLEEGQHGLYFRDNQGLELLAEAAEALIAERQAADEMPLDAYQAWVDKGWKTPHGSYQSVERLRAKLTEELNELEEAHATYEQEPSEENRRKAIEEMGDNLWLLTASAGNAGCRVDDALKDRLLEYVRGNHLLKNGKFTSPPWRDAVASAAVKYDNLTLADMHALMDAGFVLPPSPRMVLDEEDLEPRHPIEVLDDYKMYNHMLQAVMAKQRAHGGEYDESAGVHYIMMSRGFEQIAKQEVSPIVADALMQLNMIAHYGLNTSLSEIVKLNIQKVSGRVKAGFVDKQDGERPAELR